MKYGRHLVLIPILGAAILGIVFLLRGKAEQPSRPPAPPARDARIVQGPLHPAEGMQANRTVPPSGALPAATPPGAQEFLSELRARVKKARAYHAEQLQSGPSLRRGFPAQERLLLTEVRVWALAFPDEATSMAVEILRNSPLEEADRSLALNALMILAQNGNSSAFQHLERIATGENDLAKDAGDYLARAYRGDVPSQGIIKAAFEGNRRAIEALALDGSIENVSRLQSLADTLSRSDMPERKAALATVEESLQKARVLQGPEWRRSVTEVISNPGRASGHWIPWALRVIESRRLLEAREAIREYLAKAEEKELTFLRNTSPSKESPSTQLVSSMELPVHQYCYDEMLLTYSRIGGELTPLQQGRLEHYGMIGSPLEALKASLARPVER